MIIAIDGPAASGKGTLGKRLAAHYGLRHLDTGLIYRAVAKSVLDAGQRPDDVAAAVAAAAALDPARFDEAVLKSPAVGEAASLVSAIPEVRTALLAFQRDFAAEPPGAVLDGRDIGTVICPDADVKIFVTATPEVRARRRAAEYRAQGKAIDEAGVLADIRQTRRTRPEPRRRPPPASPGCALARYHAFGYRRGHPGRHRHRRGHPSGPRARLTAPRCWRTKPRSSLCVRRLDKAQSLRTYGISAGHPGFRVVADGLAKTVGPYLRTPFKPPAPA